MGRSYTGRISTTSMSAPSTTPIPTEMNIARKNRQVVLIPNTKSLIGALAKCSTRAATSSPAAPPRCLVLQLRDARWCAFANRKGRRRAAIRRPAPAGRPPTADPVKTPACSGFSNPRSIWVEKLAGLRAKASGSQMTSGNRANPNHGRRQADQHRQPRPRSARPLGGRETLRQAPPPRQQRERSSTIRRIGTATSITVSKRV